MLKQNCRNPKSTLTISRKLVQCKCLYLAGNVCGCECSIDRKRCIALEYLDDQTFTNEIPIIILRKREYESRVADISQMYLRAEIDCHVSLYHYTSSSITTFDALTVREWSLQMLKTPTFLDYFAKFLQPYFPKQAFLTVFKK